VAKPLTWTKAELQQVIREGGSVMHRGHIIMHPDHVPTEKELRAAHEGVDAVEEIGGSPYGPGPRLIANAVGDPTGDPNPISHGEENTDPETGSTISSAAVAALNAQAGNKPAKSTQEPPKE
jgi:hypothetical protein